MICPHCGKEISLPKPAKCNKCGKEIVFLITHKGKKIPVDIETWDGKTMEFIYGTNIPHFETCGITKTEPNTTEPDNLIDVPF